MKINAHHWLCSILFADNQAVIQVSNDKFQQAVYKSYAFSQSGI